MRRKVLSVIALLVLMQGGLMGAVIGEVEPNNDILNAQNINAALPVAVIIGTGDGTFDYFSFFALAGQIWRFETTAGNFDTELFLYMTDGTLLAANDDGGVGLLSLINYTFLSSGTYVIGLGEFNSIGSVGGITGNTPDTGDTYELTVTNLSIPEPSSAVLFTLGLAGILLARRKA